MKLTKEQYAAIYYERMLVYRTRDCIPIVSQLYGIARLLGECAAHGETDGLNDDFFRRVHDIEDDEDEADFFVGLWNEAEDIGKLNKAWPDDNSDNKETEDDVEDLIVILEALIDAVGCCTTAPTSNTTIRLMTMLADAIHYTAEQIRNKGDAE